MAVFIPVRRIDNNLTEEANPSYETLHVRMIRVWVTRERRLFDKVFSHLETFSVVPSFYMS